MAQWKYFPEKLQSATNCNILAYDRIGHGLSSANTKTRSLEYLKIEADFLKLLLGKLSIHKPHLLGHSDGSSIALLYAANESANCKSVISLAAHVLVEYITLLGIRKTQSLYHSKLKALLEKYHYEKTNKIFNDWISIWLNPAFKQWNMLDILAKNQVPVLAIQGDRDEYGSRIQLDKIKSITQSQTVELTNCGHPLYLDKTDAIIQLAEHFLSV